jgi:hypothetical protein
MSHFTISPSLSAEACAQLSERLTNRLLDELTRLEAPQSAFELLYGVSFFSLASAELQRDGPFLVSIEKDFPAFTRLAFNALAATGGLS